MLGPVLIALAVVIVLPVSFMMMGAAVSFLFGWSLADTAEHDAEGTPAAELVDTNN